MREGLGPVAVSGPAISSCSCGHQHKGLDSKWPGSVRMRLPASSYNGKDFVFEI